MMMNVRSAALKAVFALGFVSLASSAYAETKLLMSSAAGDDIGQGLSYSYTNEVNSTIGVAIAYPTQDSTSTSFGAIEVTVSGDDGKNWTLDFDANSSSRLAVGTYSAAIRFPFNNGGAGLAVYGDGRGCNEDFGTFQVYAVNYIDDSTVDSFAATFTQHCESQSAPALTGSIEVNVPAGTIPLPTAPNGAPKLSGLAIDSKGKIKGLIQNAGPAGCIISVLSGSSPAAITTQIFKKSVSSATAKLKTIPLLSKSKAAGVAGQKIFLEAIKQCAGYQLGTSKVYSLKLPPKKK